MKRIGLLGVLVACGGAQQRPPTSVHVVLSIAADDRMVTVPAGQYIAGSTPEERAAAYDDYQQSAGTDDAREAKWFEQESDRRIAELEAFRMDLMPVTQAQYAEMVTAGKASPPSIDEAAWKAQGFQQDYATVVTRNQWKDGRPPPGREDHPVVLVTHTEAASYCAWRGEQRGQPRRLPTAAEYEKAARGEAGFTYPWGNAFDAAKLNSAVAGPKDTTPAGQFNDGASPFGVLELAGNVFQWTATPEQGDRMVVKGSAWEDFAGLGRGASFHGRPKTARHVIVGFRCAADA
jgi:formylglycine-generating enzyme required for sulfatase activity